jgi:hypothetical protein
MFISGRFTAFALSLAAIRCLAEERRDWEGCISDQFARAHPAPLGRPATVEEVSG